MSLQIKDASVWTPPYAWYAKDNDTWQDADLWVKVGSTWRQMVPPNAIILYTGSVPTSGVLADGSNNTPNLLSKYLSCGSNTPLTLRGASTHSGSDHGAASNTKTGVSNGGVNSGNPTKSDNHNHTLASHTHTGSGSNDVTRRNIMPYMFGSKLYSGALVPGLSDLTSGLLTFLAGHLHRLYLANSVGTSTHTHNHGSAGATYTGYYTPVTNRTYNGSSGFEAVYTHRHLGNHPSVEVMHVTRTTFMPWFTVTSDMYFDELPLDSVVFFTSQILPDGWTQYIDDYSLFRGTSTVGGASGTSGITTSSHESGSTSGGAKDYGTSTEPSGGTGGTYISASHNHGNNIHNSYADIMPLSVDLVIAYKE